MKPGMRYPVRIRVQGELGSTWSAMFDGLGVEARADGTTVITGELRDQTALHGVLATVRDLGLSLLSVETAASPAPAPEPDDAGQRIPAASSIQGIVASDPRAIPSSHLDLVECPPVAALTTVMPDGYPQTSAVWCDFDGQFVRVNTMRGFQKERNMRRNPKVTLLGYDPRELNRYLEVRGTVVEMTEDGALDHLDALASKYAGRRVRYFGDCIPARFAETETPVLSLIEPTRVVVMDATRKAAER